MPLLLADSILPEPTFFLRIFLDITDHIKVYENGNIA